MLQSILPPYPPLPLPVSFVVTGGFAFDPPMPLATAADSATAIRPSHAPRQRDAPEPATTALLAVGVLAFAFLGLLRRRAL